MAQQEHAEQHPITIEAHGRLVGQTLGTSPWTLIDQPRIDGFAAITGDRQFIHVDPIAAAQTPFGGTIAHGFLTLSLLGEMGLSILPQIVGAEMSVNYGLEGVRFLHPVRSGKRVRGHFTLKEVQERASGQWQSTYDVSVEIEGGAKPALVAKWLVLYVIPCDDAVVGA